MKPLIALAVVAILLPSLASAQNRQVDTTPIQNFILPDYLGTWYEIARLDHSFERGMNNVTAEYFLRDDGKIDVLNSGWKNGEFKVANGKAKQPYPASNPAHLMVSFFLFFYNDYKVLMLDPYHQISLVGSSSPKYLWILSRSPKVSKLSLAPILKEAQERGYDTSKLIWVDQSMHY
jgi:lipocalin